jgi:hypothetical protein
VSLSRRKFLKHSSLTVLLAGFPLSLAGVAAGKGWSVATPGLASSARIPAAIERDPLNTFTVESFLPHLNTSFRVGQMGAPASVLKLVKVTDLRPSSSADATAAATTPRGPQCYSLLFRGSHAQALQQHNHPLQHRTLGDFSMLLAPVVSKDKKALYYEAIVNQRRA